MTSRTKTSLSAKSRFVSRITPALVLGLLITLHCTGCESQSSQAIGLHRAVAKGDEKRVTAYLRRNPDLVRATDDDIFRRLPMHTAARAGEVKAAEQLLETVSKRHFGSQYERIFTDFGVLKQSLAFGASVECKDSKNNTPLHIAAQHGRSAFVQMLIANKCDIEQVNDAR